MTYDITLEILPAGYACNNVKAGETFTLQRLEFTSSEDGGHFIQRLEGFPSELLVKAVGKEIDPAANVSYLLGIIRRDRTATVHINNFDVMAEVQPTRGCNAGDLLAYDDIADITRVQFGDEIVIPDDCGIVYVFSIGWRKGLFYDFTTLGTNGLEKRGYDLSRALGQCHAYLIFQKLFGITDVEWKTLFAAQWFPFRPLGEHLIKKMVAHVRAGWSPDELIDEVVERLTSTIDGYVECWRGTPVLQEHFPLLVHVAERFKAADYVSATAILYPRIEGMLRSYWSALGSTRKATQSALSQVSSGDTSGFRNRVSALLLDRFEKYLTEVYFAAFDPQHAAISVSRNSVGHGVAASKGFDAKAASIGLMIIQQLYYHFAPIVAKKP